jgi:hypothetical protein
MLVIEPLPWVDGVSMQWRSIDKNKERRFLNQEYHFQDAQNLRRKHEDLYTNAMSVVNKEKQHGSIDFVQLVLKAIT